MGETTNHNLPFPEPSDPPDVVGDLKRLSEKIDENLSDLEIEISAEADNVIVEKPDGLYAPTTDLTDYAKTDYVNDGDAKAVTDANAYTDAEIANVAVCFPTYESLDNCDPVPPAAPFSDLVLKVQQLEQRVAELEGKD